jgi:hypothetical protein
MNLHLHIVVNNVVHMLYIYICIYIYIYICVSYYVCCDICGHDSYKCFLLATCMMNIYILLLMRSMTVIKYSCKLNYVV